MYSDRRVNPVTGNGGRRNEWQGHIFDRKLIRRMRSKNRPKTCLLCHEIAKILAPYGQSQSLKTTVFKPDINLTLSTNCNKTANTNGKKT